MEAVGFPGSLTDDNLAERRLPYDNPALHSKLDKICGRLKAKILHDAVFMKSHGARRDIQNARRFFHRLPFRQELDDLALARC